MYALYDFSRHKTLTGRHIIDEQAVKKRSVALCRHSRVWLTRRCANIGPTAQSSGKLINHVIKMLFTPGLKRQLSAKLLPKGGRGGAAAGGPQEEQLLALLPRRNRTVETAASCLPKDVAFGGRVVDLVNIDRDRRATAAARASTRPDE